MKHLILSAIVTFAGLHAHELSARTFTDTQGREIEATVVEIDEDSAKLKLDSNGKTHDIPFTKLSQQDVDFLKASMQAEADEAESAKQTSKKKSKKNKRKSTQDLIDEHGLKENFDAPWPGIVSVSVSTEASAVTENKEENIFIYHSPNYEFTCDVRLSKSVLTKFAVMFEATRELYRQLPISSMKAHVPGEQHRNKILLFETKETYLKNGGPIGSAGAYFPAKDAILVPLTSLGVKKVGSSYMFDHDKSNKTLPHEIIHQLTDGEYYASGAIGWFSEGMADYCATTPYRSGKFLVKTNASAIKEYATAYGKDNNGGRNMGTEFDAPDLKSYMTMSYGQFTQNGNFNYGLGLLITYYFFHMEDDRSNITAFLKALKEGKEGDAALEVLLNGRSYDELEEQITKKWRSKGVRITFK